MEQLRGSSPHVRLSKDRALSMGKVQSTPLSPKKRMTQLPKVCIIQSWIVKRTREHDFLTAWRTHAKWIVNQEGSTGSARLFKDTLDPAHYVSVHSWEEEKVSTATRGVEFGRQTYKLEQLTVNFSSWKLKLEGEEYV